MDQGWSKFVEIFAQFQLRSKFFFQIKSMIYENLIRTDYHGS